jgi:hypothetical protein
MTLLLACPSRSRPARHGLLMLVNTIAFYPRPLRLLAPAAVLKDGGFGAPVIRQTLILAPSAVAFGAQVVAISRRYVQPTVVNAQFFGENQVQLRSRTYLAQAAVTNANVLGSHRFKNKQLQTAVSNVTTFGAHTIAAAEKKFSYSNTLGTRNRTGTITATLAGVSTGAGSDSQLVNGSSSNEFWWNGGSGATLIRVAILGDRSNIVIGAIQKPATLTTSAGRELCGFHTVCLEIGPASFDIKDVTASVVA